MIKILFPLLFLPLLGCSSSDTVEIQVPNPDEDALDEVFGTNDSESNSENDELPLESFGSIELPNDGFDSIPGRELVGDLAFDPVPEQDGITISITSFGFISFTDILAFNVEGDPRVTVRLDNQSNSAIERARCDVEALQNGVMVIDGTLSFAGLGFIDPGESAISNITFFDDFPDGFNSFNELRLADLSLIHI